MTHARRFLQLLSISAFSVCLLASCSSSPNKSARHYTAPSVAPVRTAIATAKSQTAIAQISVDQALKLIGPNGVAPADVPALRIALERAQNSIDLLTRELLGADVLINELEAQTKQLTADANREARDKQAALARAADLSRRLEAEIAHVRKLKRMICGLAAAAAAAGTLLLLFRIQLPPPLSGYLLLVKIAGPAAVGGLVYGALWFRL